MEPHVRLDASVSGRVQGVGFRWFVIREARRLGLVGWVANERDGTVRTVAEGPSAAIDDLEALLAEGPPGAAVERVASMRTAAAGRFAGFEVRAAGHPGD